MGKTAFGGPVYGAKTLLWSEQETISTGGTTALVCARAIPVYEDWFITEVYARYGTAASTISSAATAFLLKSEGGSTTGIVRGDGYASTVAQTLVTLSKTGSTTVLSSGARVTGSAGEYEGLYVPAGSTLRWVSSGVDAIKVNLQVMGFIRWVSSTRAV